MENKGKISKRQPHFLTVQVPYVSPVLPAAAPSPLWAVSLLTELSPLWAVPPLTALSPLWAVPPHTALSPVSASSSMVPSLVPQMAS